jgi:RNA polymerase sigma-70 factor (ECF subfamily)
METRRAERTDLAEVIARLHSRMVAAAFRILRDQHDARDAVQDAYLRAVVHLERFDGRGQLSTWLHRIVVNAAFMRLRAQRRRPVEHADTDVFPDAAADVEATVARREMQALVRRSLATVAGNHRIVLLMRDIEDRDATEVSRALGVTRGALRIRTHRARNALRAHLLRMGVDADDRRARSSRKVAASAP